MTWFLNSFGWTGGSGGGGGNTCATPNPQEIFVDANVGDDSSGNGSSTCPFKTIQYAITLCTNPSITYTLVLGNSIYTGSDVNIPSNVNIEGNGSSIQFKLILDSTGLSGTQVQPYYNDCTFQEFEFDLSAYSIALPVFTVCLINILTRLDDYDKGIIRVSDSSISDFNIVGTVVFNNVSFLSSGTVSRRGNLLIQSSIINIKINIESNGVITLIGCVLDVSGFIVAADDTVIVYTDSTSASGFGGSIIGTTNIVYLDNAETIKYNPLNPSNFVTPPTTVKEGLDYLSNSLKGFSFIFKNTNNVNISQFLNGLQNLASNTDPYQILESSILYGVAAQTASLNVGQNWDAEVYVNGVLIPAATLNLNNIQSNRNSVSISLNAGDNISVRCNKIGVPNLLRPQIQLFIKAIAS